MSSSSTPPNAAAPIRWESLVAIGDSFTEGLWDPYPGEEDRQRGWADLLAQELSTRRIAAGQSPLRYANLAIRGRKTRAILTEQLPAAIALKPDLVSLVTGGNDILRVTADIDLLASNLDAAVGRLRNAGIEVMIGTGFRADTPLIRMTRSRTGELNAHVWSIARKYDAYVLDLWGMRCLDDLRLWSADRIHPTPAGHRKVAQGALVALGLAPDDPLWNAPATPEPPGSVVDRVRIEAQWARQHVVPWVERRVKRVSSGDGREPKAPVLAEVVPQR